ncbi:MAG TPA: archaeal heat shock protein Hsp20 [Candidatus Bathyarchaeia archaeon]|jgi:HSP20 family protein|nr:archaeal heat shock protein Hsp20 [Candidatus Bathyarchaeia archaeon]
MSSGDIEPFDWSRRLFGLGRRGFFEDMFRGFDQMRREMEKEFEDMEKTIPKDLIREYTTSEGGKVREVGPMVYGYSMTVGPDGKPRIREFGNVKPSRIGFAGFSRPEISSETEPLVDVTTTDNEVRVVVEMPGVGKDKIKVNAYDNMVEVKSEDPRRKYHRTIEIPAETDIETAKSNYNNGILEITFKKKEQTKGKTIKVE